MKYDSLNFFVTFTSSLSSTQLFPLLLFKKENEFFSKSRSKVNSHVEFHICSIVYCLAKTLYFLLCFIKISTQLPLLSFSLNFFSPLSRVWVFFIYIFPSFYSRDLTLSLSTMKHTHSHGENAKSGARACRYVSSVFSISSDVKHS